MTRHAKPYRKTLEQMQEEHDWTPAEQQLLAEAHTGMVFIPGGKPDRPNPAQNIRADLIRHITLGGCKTCRVPDKGVHVIHAVITGLLEPCGKRNPAGPAPLRMPV